MIFRWSVFQQFQYSSIEIVLSIIKWGEFLQFDRGVASLRVEVKNWEILNLSENPEFLALRLNIGHIIFYSEILKVHIRHA